MDNDRSRYQGIILFNQRWPPIPSNEDEDEDEDEDLFMMIFSFLVEKAIL